MKKSIILLAAILFFKENLLSQVKKDSAIYKNEIGVNLIPVIIVLSTGGPFFFRNKIQYKRRLKPNLYYRAGLAVERGRHFNNGDFYINEVGKTDTTVLITIYSEKRGKERGIFQGIEYRWGKKKIKQFCGADLGYSYSESSSKLMFGRRNLNAAGPYWTHGIVGADTTIYSNRYFNNGINLKAFYGVQFHFTRQLFFSLQLGLNLKINFVRIKYEVERQYQSSTSTYRQINFANESPLQDFSLFYRF